MSEFRNGMAADGVPGARWRKSSRSGAVGNCVELSPVDEIRTAVRDSKNPSGPALLFPGAVIESFTRAVKDGHVATTDASHAAEAYLRKLVSRGFEFLHPRDASGEIAAVVGVRAHHNVIDVVRLHAEDEVIATRLPGDTDDVLNPDVVLWHREGWAAEVLRQMIDLPDDRTPGSLGQLRDGVETVVNGCWVPTSPGRSKWLPASA
ncbi:DUF397 domain-containing protein [Actinokineospora globicatena]|uniref:DUF397 domain-containing protein n=1 Tax=Actinokineospora globicatena TaxID=103729 RepID=A0A9W6VDB4_9PSEU|nr:DUF397 domain-containing protein [Actinokineospora globicatena]MCP2305460.1 protein of unknown function (DUF397) [Actinokineospora globicatena]GLW81328.1 hypothetical protein Aglo01_58090 [Actinokineospora globicatena]GLW87974.1 hypothetical protein Aglo02_56130 [Actinokineospora globicatena]GLW95839.1 hypothetical protein Aglo03_66550 [Actinokineospora globicatena]